MRQQYAIRCKFMVLVCAATPNKSSKSVSWDYFSFADGKAVDDGSAIYHICRRRVLAKYGNTLNLYSYSCKEELFNGGCTIDTMNV